VEQAGSAMRYSDRQRQPAGCPDRLNPPLCTAAPPIARRSQTARAAHNVQLQPQSFPYSPYPTTVHPFSLEGVLKQFSTFIATVSWFNSH